MSGRAIDYKKQRLRRLSILINTIRDKKLVRKYQKEKRFLENKIRFIEKNKYSLHRKNRKRDLKKEWQG